MLKKTFYNILYISLVCFLLVICILIWIRQNNRCKKLESQLEYLEKSNNMCDVDVVQKNNKTKITNANDTYDVGRNITKKTLEPDDDINPPNDETCVNIIRNDDIHPFKDENVATVENAPLSCILPDEDVKFNTDAIDNEAEKVNQKDISIQPLIQNISKENKTEHNSLEYISHAKIIKDDEIYLPLANDSKNDIGTDFNRESIKMEEKNTNLLSYTNLDVFDCKCTSKSLFIDITVPSMSDLYEYYKQIGTPDKKFILIYIVQSYITEISVIYDINEDIAYLQKTLSNITKVDTCQYNNQYSLHMNHIIQNVNNYYDFESEYHKSFKTNYILYAHKNKMNDFCKDFECNVKHSCIYIGKQTDVYVSFFVEHFVSAGTDMDFRKNKTYEHENLLLKNV